MKRIGAIMITAMLNVLLCSRVLLAGISVDPTVNEKVLEPGTSEEGTYIVTNTGENKIDVTIEYVDWMEKLFYQKDEMDVHDWLTVEPTQITLDPGQKAELKYKVKAPFKFTTEKVAQIYFAFSETPNLISRLGVIFYLSPKSPSKLLAEITQLSASQAIKEDTKEKQLVLHFEIQNDSSVHIRPQGAVNIVDEKGNVFKQMILNNVPGIYPNKTFPWNHVATLNDLPPGNYKVEMTLDYGHTYGQQGHVMQKTVDLKWEDQPQEAKA